jgi:anti-sigma B factor antagonist
MHAVILVRANDAAYCENCQRALQRSARGGAYVDSAGLGELVQCCAAVRTRGGVLKLLNVTRRLSDLLVVTKLLTVFDCFDGDKEAIASFARSA